MKLDHDEKEMLESFERGEWRSVGGAKREKTRYALRPRHVSQGPPPEHSDFEQGSRSHSEARPRGGTPLPDPDRKPAPQVRIRAIEGGVIDIPLGMSLRQTRYGSHRSMRRRMTTVMGEST